MKDRLLTSGQFAKLCNTTKETLRHYNKMELLQPVWIKENGYQYYSYRQVYDYYLIVTLKYVGCSLEQINEYLNGPKQSEMKSVLELELKNLAEEKRQLEIREQLLKKSLKQFDVMEEFDGYNSFTVKEEEEAYFIIGKVEDINLDVYWIEANKKLEEYCEEHNICIPLQASFVEVLNEERKLETLYVAAKLDEKDESRQLFIKPKGQYLKYLAKGSYHPESLYQKVFAYADKRGYQLDNYLYETEVSLCNEKSEEYVVEISARIL